MVPFGRNKVYSGLIKQLHENPPSGFQARYIHSLLDEDAVVTPMQFAFWEWVAKYYLCTEGEVMQAALPPAMKLSGETRIAINPLYRHDGEPLGEKEQALLQALENRRQLTLGQAADIASLARVLPLIKTMMARGMVILKEELENPWRPKLVRFISLTPLFTCEKILKDLFGELERKAPRQLEVLMQYFREAGVPGNEEAPGQVAQEKLTTPVKGGYAALQALMKKGVFQTTEKVVSYFDHLQANTPTVSFNEHQEKAHLEIRALFETKHVVLLHGVTSSGKTEIYIKLIREAMERGEQVLYLLPEIALTAQIISRLQGHFGDKAGIYHSRFNPMERTEVWNNLLGRSPGSDGYGLILGPRSAMFLPFRKLGLVIIDEEHEPSYKQHDPAPRYHARDAAIYLASMHGARVLLGSATPSLEVYSQAQKGKFGHVHIDKRHGGVRMPEILVADVRKDTRSGAMKSHFSPLLLRQMEESLAAGEQVMLFQNRRGFSLRLECDICQWVPGCHQCDVSLVYHKKNNRLCCHYCGYSMPPPGICSQCGSTAVKMKGFGTEKIEEELPLFFPEARIGRMDLDTTRSKNAYRRIIEDFEQRKIDILVGTQMISKGLDFDNVGVVGILNADNLLNFPDFRAHERAFQLMAQVSGRAGRHLKRGKVIIQAYNVGHPVIKQVIANDYEAMFRQQMSERKQFHYPPFTRLVRLTTLHGDEKLTDQASDQLAIRLKKAFPGKVLGPEYPVVTRIKNQFMKNILVKLDRSTKLVTHKAHLNQIIREFQKEKAWKQVRIIFNVDPV